MPYDYSIWAGDCHGALRAPRNDRENGCHCEEGRSPDEAISLFQYFWKYPHDCDTTAKDCHGPFRALAMTKKRNYPHNGKERVLAMPDLRDPKELCWHHYYFNVILNQVFVKLITFLEGPKSLLNTPYI